MLPSNNSTEVKKLLAQTDEANTLISKFGNPPIDAVEDVTPYIKNLKSAIPLMPKGLLDIAKVLKISNELKEYIGNAELNEFPLLTEIFDLLYTNAGIYNQISHCILDENNIADDASKTLNSLRRNRRRLESAIKEKLNSFIHSASYAKYIMEPIITIRNERYVIPVKIEYKENVNGLIHDISASGSTVYIEPTAVFDLNNKINNIKLEENIEIEKILKDLSNLLYPIVQNIEQTINVIGSIDLIFAKASYSRKIDGITPIINEQKFINLTQARHPLIDKAVVVPIDIHIGKDFKSLVITGPNTGGKTVTLKTVGLLCLMAYIGLCIPAKEGSSLYVFDNIFADIGDEQSIQESLSTFSSHMVNIVSILKNSTENSLVLIDELGSGTDPVQGANLAISILESFYNKGALTLTTTHYPEIKNYALVTDGFENASSEFDIENLRPTYRILIGVPGKSNAFAISKKLGLPADILSRAESLLTEDHISIEELIKNIYDDKLAIEKEKEKTIKNSNQIELLRKKLETNVSDVEDRRNEIINNAKNEARSILLAAKEEANSIIKDLNNLYESADKNALKDANALRNSLNDDLKGYASNNTNFIKNDNENSLNVLSKSDITVGMEALVKPFNMVGTILTLPSKSNEVMVQFGSTKTKVKIQNLEKVNSSKGKDAGHTGSAKNYGNRSSSIKSNLKSKSIVSEINVIGMNVDDATCIVDKYLDDCYVANLNTARIVHGKGTGKLREGIHYYIKKHPHVKSFRLGTFGEGEMGVTVVEIK